MVNSKRKNLLLNEKLDNGQGGIMKYSAHYSGCVRYIYHMELNYGRQG